MTQEEKSLLLKDLCVRLPYGVKVHCKWNLFQGDRISENGELVSINTHTVSIKFKRNNGRITEIPFNRIDGAVLPYLRPMSSMTEEECKTLGNIPATLEHNLIEVLPNIPYYIEVAVPDQIDWLNAHHFDFRNLIERGLAIDCTGLNVY